MTVTAIQDGRYRITHKNGDEAICESLAELHEVCHIFSEALKIMQKAECRTQNSVRAVGCGAGGKKKRVILNRLPDEKIAP